MEQKHIRTWADSPVFPEDQYYNEQIIGQRNGITKREYFAAKALQGLLYDKPESVYPDLVKQTAQLAVILADALINELNKPVQ